MPRLRGGGVEEFLREGLKSEDWFREGGKPLIQSLRHPATLKNN